MRPPARKPPETIGSETGINGFNILFDPRLLRSRWFDILSRAMDAYLRSPLFLATIRLGLSASIAAQSLQAGHSVGGNAGKQADKEVGKGARKDVGKSADKPGRRRSQQGATIP
jgi:hypothetical protein